jgi:hypothetical protein
MDKKNNILRKLNNKDVKEIKNSAQSNYVSFPRLGADGRILPSQWKSWQVLQRYGLGFIKGNYESGEFKLSELGKEIAKEIK